MSIRKYIKSNWNVICDVCGRKRKKSETLMSFGSGITPVLVTCKDGCSDDVHPLNFPPPVIFDGRPVPNARPDATEDNNQTYVPITNPSFFTWGNFPNVGTWGNFQTGGFTTIPKWTWGNFSKG